MAIGLGLALSLGGGDPIRAQAVSAASLASDRAYLTDVGMLAGHVRVVMELYRIGQPNLAVRHFEKTGGPLFKRVTTEATRRNLPDPAPPLAVLGRAVVAHRALPDVETAYASVLSTLQVDLAPITKDPAAAFGAMVALVQAASKDYAAGVIDSTVTSPIRYRTAWGEVQSARALADSLVGSSTANVDAAAFKAIEALGRASDAFAGMAPDAPIPAQSGLLNDVATKIAAAGATIN